MQSVQRKFGKLMKRSADGADVGGILNEFNVADKSLTAFIEATKSWRNAWDETLKTQLYVAETMFLLYKPIEVEDDPANPVQQKPAPTPRRCLDKAGDLQTVYSALGKDLGNEVNSIEPKLMRPAMDAKDSLKSVKKAIKRREDCKLDYERYNSRVDTLRRKEARSAREENALMKHETDLARASAEYHAADDNLKRMLPPVLDALSVLIPTLLAIQIMIQHQLVGQMYTQLHEYCQAHQLPSSAPEMELVVSTFEAEFTSLRLEIESEFKILSTGKAIHQPMSLPDKQQGTVTGLGIRNTFQRRTSSQGSSPKPTVPGQARIGASVEPQEEEAPIRPPRPGRIPSGTRLHSHYEDGARLQSHVEEEEAPPTKPPRPGMAPRVDTASKPRIPSSSKPTPAFAPEGHSYNGATPPAYSAISTPSSSTTPYLTPLTSRQESGGDYFGKERKLSTSSGTSFSTVGKKKPPPPPPKKRLPSFQSQFVTALFDFGGQGEGDLSFREGDRIKVVKKTESTDDWWEGELHGMVGSFPANYVKMG